MDRHALLRQAFDRSAELQLSNPMYRRFVLDVLNLQLKGDLGVEGDITTKILLNGELEKAAIIAKEAGTIAGIAETQLLYQKNDVQVQALVQDGDKVKSGTPLMEIKGNLKLLLMLERTAVNVLQRMSGIATYTTKLVKLSPIPIAATRKTLWGYMDKRAVALGGGLTHRLNLAEAVLIKSNHLKALAQADPIRTALQAAWQKKEKAQFIEIEVQTEEELFAATQVCAELHRTDAGYPLLIMLDNLGATKVKEYIAKIREAELFDAALFEASGGITEQNITQYGKTGVDVLSLGSLTHSVIALNCAFKLE